MGITIFSMLSIAACVFLIYVLFHFHQELTRFDNKSTAHSLTYLGSYENKLVISELSVGASQYRHPQDKAVPPQGVLVDRAFALVGLFAPFVLVKLLHSSSIWHR